MSSGMGENSRNGKSRWDKGGEAVGNGKGEILTLLSQPAAFLGLQLIFHSIVYNNKNLIIYIFILRFLTYNDQKRITILKYTKYVHKLSEQ